MASFTAGITFVDGVANDVTAAKLGALVTNATPTSGLIKDRTTEAVVATNDTFLIGDASDSDTLKRMTVANVMKAELTGTINTTAGTITTLNSTTGTITTGVIPTLTSITKITSGTGTAAAPAISPTGDTNTGIFFPAADTIAFAEGGTEGMRIDSSGNVGIGTTSPSTKLDVDGVLQLRAVSGEGGQMQLLNTDNASNGLVIDVSAADTGRIFCSNNNSVLQLGQLAGTGGIVSLYTAGAERLRIDGSGNVGIGDSSPAAKLDVNGSFNATSGTIPTLVATTLLTTGTGTAAAPAIVPTGDTNTGIFFPAADTIALTEGGTESLRINSSGNVSIGTATALSRLHVHGDLTMSNATTAASASAGGVTIPATVAGYLSVTINGTSRRIPYFAA
jgi:hypothetical protein